MGSCIEHFVDTSFDSLRDSPEGSLTPGVLLRARILDYVAQLKCQKVTFITGRPHTKLGTLSAAC